MYCYHCGYEINEKAIEAKASSKAPYIEEEGALDADVQYVCPRCGHLIHAGCDHQDIKNLSAACHAEQQRGRNDFAKGMSNLAIAVILGITGFLFLLLSKKADNQFKVTTSCAEFYIFLVLSIIAVILIAFGAFFVTRGLLRKHKYTALLKDINTETFVQ